MEKLFWETDWSSGYCSNLFISPWGGLTFSLAVKNDRGESGDHESSLMALCMGSRFPLRAWGRNRACEPESPWAGVGKEGGYKGSRGFRKAKPDRDPESLTWVGRAERSGGGQQFRGKWRELRKVRTSECRRGGERAGCGQRGGCEI